jgi:hypothetical protein
MKGSRFTEEQIIGILREQEAHKAEILRVVEALGVSQQGASSRVGAPPRSPMTQNGLKPTLSPSR